MSSSAKSFLDLITRLQVVLTEIDYVQKECLQAGKMECQLLNYLSTVNEPVNMNELAKSLDVSHSRITRIMDNLVNKKLVTRRPSEKDRRCWYAIITEKGKKLAENSQQTLLEQQKRIIAGLPDKEIDNVYKALKTYVEQYEALLQACMTES
ncbi:MAG: MarR family winged helix-turn-helix transcriptional regulator [Candidatus Cloacimonadaceae bacterium]|jgi:DNA-binding MarR family transcriptional regulator